MLYAAKANDAGPIMEALVQSGINGFDVASLVEIERMAAFPGAELYFMNPVKPRSAIRRAYREFGIRSFAFDSEDELDKIIEETGRAKDLTLYLRLACPNTHSLIPLEGKFGTSSAEAPALLLRARQVARRLGITFHVGSQAVVPAAFGEALRQVGQLIVASGVLVDAIDIGEGSQAVIRIPIRPILRTIPMRSSRRGRSLPSRIPASFFASPDGRWWRRPSWLSSGSMRAAALRFMSMTAPSARCSTRPMWAFATRRD